MAQEVMQLVEDWRGWNALSEKTKPAGYDVKLKETMDILSNARGLPPHVHEFQVREVLTTADFPLLFGDITDRSMITTFCSLEANWKKYAKAKPTNKNFLPANIFSMYGGTQALDEVAEKGEYLASEREELRYQLSLKKYGRQFDISWESIVNDELGALTDTPDRFARAAALTELQTMIALYASDIGAHVEGAGGALYQNLINSVAGALTIATLETGLEMMAALTDVPGDPCPQQMKYLVVPPSLEMTARQILTSTHKMWTDDAGGVFRASPTTNVVSQMGLELIVEPYLQILNAGGTGLTGWYLFADPNQTTALEYAHLAGHENPEICMKASDKVAVGGGPLGPMTGDFATDDIFYRVRHCFGATKMDWRGTFHGF